MTDPARTRNFCVTEACESSPNTSAPKQAPKLVRIRQWYASSDSQVFDRKLLEQVSDDPDESAKKEPKEHGPYLGRVEDGGMRATVKGKNERKHSAELPYRKCSHKR